MIIATGGHKHMLCNLGVKFEIQNCGVDLLEHKNSTFLEVKRLKANVKSVIYFELSTHLWLWLYVLVPSYL